MASGKYLAIDANGNKVEEQAINASTGVGDAAKIIRTDSTGKIDPTLVPGAELKTLMASEILSAGDLVNVWDDTGVAKVRKADASAVNAGKRADGFILASAAVNDMVTVYSEGIDNQLSGLTLGGDYFLSATAGAVTLVPVTTSGYCLQRIGTAFSATELSFEPGEPIIRV